MENKRSFVTFSELAVGFDEYSLSQSEDFNGKTITLYLENGSTFIYRFVSPDTLVFTENELTPIAAMYNLVMPRAGIYYLNCVVSYGDTRCITSVIDTEKKIATVSIGTLPSMEEALIPQITRGDKNMPLTSVRADFIPAAVGSPFRHDTPRHEKTSDLVGRRINFIYSDSDEYEHIYLTDKSFVWRCVRGIESGLADTELCYYYKIADNLYWFTWCERVVPTLGSVLEDLDAMRSFGSLFAYEDYSFRRVKNVCAGSYARYYST